MPKKWKKNIHNFYNSFQVKLGHNKKKISKVFTETSFLAIFGPKLVIETQKVSLGPQKNGHFFLRPEVVSRKSQKTMNFGKWSQWNHKQLKLPW